MTDPAILAAVREAAIRKACAEIRNSNFICDCRDYGRFGQTFCAAAVERAGSAGE